MNNIIELTKKLVDKLEEIGKSDEFIGVFQLAQIHGCPYTGPTYEEELNALKEALDNLKTILNNDEEKLIAELLSDPRRSLSTIWPEKAIAYFNDYSEDAALPSSGKKDLVQQYKEIMDKKNKPIAVFDNREELYDFVSEFGPQASDGVHGFKEYSEAEMLELINEAKKHT